MWTGKQTVTTVASTTVPVTVTSSRWRGELGIPSNLLTASRWSPHNSHSKQRRVPSFSEETRGHIHNQTCLYSVDTRNTVYGIQLVKSTSIVIHFLELPFRLESLTVAQLTVI